MQQKQKREQATARVRPSSDSNFIPHNWTGTPSEKYGICQQRFGEMRGEVVN